MTARNEHHPSELCFCPTCEIEWEVTPEPMPDGTVAGDPLTALAANQWTHQIVHVNNRDVRVWHPTLNQGEGDSVGHVLHPSNLLHCSTFPAALGVLVELSSYQPLHMRVRNLLDDLDRHIEGGI